MVLCYPECWFNSFDIYTTFPDQDKSKEKRKHWFDSEYVFIKSQFR